MTIRTSAWLALLACSNVGCVLADYENGPAVSNHLGDAAPEDVPNEWPALPDAANPDTLVPDAAADVADVTQEVLVDAGLCATNPDGNDLWSWRHLPRTGLPGGSLRDGFSARRSGVRVGSQCLLGSQDAVRRGVCGSPKALADGTNWDQADTWRRCCGGEPLRMDTNENCGVCGIQCNTGDGQSCKANVVNGLYYCEGCFASAACWSGCCSMSFGEPYRCAASDCKGNCIDCPGSSICVTSTGASLACAYP